MHRAKKKQQKDLCIFFYGEDDDDNGEFHVFCKEKGRMMKITHFTERKKKGTNEYPVPLSMTTAGRAVASMARRGDTQIERERDTNW